MPYNSSSFQKQLERYKNEQAAKKAAKIDTSQIVQPAVKNLTGRGTIQPSQGYGASTMADAQQKATTTAPQHIISNNNGSQPGFAKPLYRRGWFMFIMAALFAAALSSGAIREHARTVGKLAEQVKATTGSNPVSIDTLKTMATSLPAVAATAQPQPAAPAAAVADQPQPAAAATATAVPADFHDAVNKAAERAAEITAQGPEKSMQYIEEETKRLNEMAKQFDEQHKKP